MRAWAAAVFGAALLARLAFWLLPDQPLLYAPTVGVPRGRLQDNLDATLEIFGQVSRSPQGREAAAQRGEAERSVGPREGGKASEDQQVAR